MLRTTQWVRATQNRCNFSGTEKYILLGFCFHWPFKQTSTTRTHSVHLFYGVLFCSIHRHKEEVHGVCVLFWRVMYFNDIPFWLFGYCQPATTELRHVLRFQQQSITSVKIGVLNTLNALHISLSPINKLVHWAKWCHTHMKHSKIYADNRYLNEAAGVERWVPLLSLSQYCCCWCWVLDSSVLWIWLRNKIQNYSLLWVFANCEQTFLSKYFEHDIYIVSSAVKSVWKFMHLYLCVCAQKPRRESS